MQTNEFLFLCEQLGDAIITARDFCGNERSAAQEKLKEIADDLKKSIPFTEKLFLGAIVCANEIWNHDKKMANL